MKNGKGKILVVDDHPDSLLLLTTLLESYGYAAIGAENAELGLSEAAESPPDLVVMDIDLPGMDGVDALRRLRNDHRLYDAPIIAVTAHAMNGAQEKYLAAGFDAYFAKPIDTRRFLDVVTELLPCSVDSLPTPSCQIP